MIINPRRKTFFVLLICFILSLSSCAVENNSQELYTTLQELYTTLNDNIPQFEEREITTVSFESYSKLDELGRCGVALACIGEDLMPKKERGAIGQVKPSGWQTVKYDIVDGKYLYNRCHLIGYQLSGENANENNLITGTRYFNTEGMLPFENLVADYVRETGNHVMYRVTPIFEGDNLLAKGVQMEAFSVEDGGKGVSFNVFVGNIQPGIIIDYSDGSSSLESDTAEETKIEKTQTESNDENATIYILNTNTMKFHYPTCSSVKDIKDHNRETFNGSRKWLESNGYSPCKICEQKN